MLTKADSVNIIAESQFFEEKKLSNFSELQAYFQENKIGEMKNIVLFCALGFRSALATKALKEMGFKNVANASGGFDALKNAGLEVVNKERK